MENFEKLPESMGAKLRTPKDKLLSVIEIIKDPKGNTTSVIAVEGEKKLDLSELLPEGTVFVVNDACLRSPNYGFHYRHGDPRSGDRPSTIEFPAAEINSQSGRLGMLHEIGHALTDPSNRQGLFRTIRLTIELVEASPEIDKLKTQEDCDAFIVKEFHRQMKERPMPITDEEISICINRIIRDEEVAWETVLILHHKVKDEEGIDLLGGLSDEKISEIANIDLASYRNTYMKFLPENI